MAEGNHTLPDDLDDNSTIHWSYPHPAQVVLNWTIILLILSLNLVVFVVAPRMRTIKPSTTYGVLSLAVTDFSLGITRLIDSSYHTYTGYQIHDQHPVCLIAGYGQTLFAGVSIITLTFMNIDRLLTFAYPLHYQLTKKQTVLILGILWVITLILLIPAMTGILKMSIMYKRHSFLCILSWADDLSYKLVLLFLFLLFPTILIIICFCGSFHLVRSALKHMKVENSNIHHGNSSSKSSQWKRDRRLFMMLSIMTVGFYIAWLPFEITIAIPEMITGQSLHPVTDYIAPRLAGSNSFWNPIIYMFTLRPFSTALAELCSCTPCARSFLANRGGSAGIASGNSRQEDTADRGSGNSVLHKESQSAGL